jgi:hypothetical protein
VPNPDRTVSGEVSHLMRDKGWPQKRAVAASLDMQRRGQLRKSGRTKRRGGGRT